MVGYLININELLRVVWHAEPSPSDTDRTRGQRLAEIKMCR